jgi:hypothetical protein
MRTFTFFGVDPFWAGFFAVAFRGFAVTVAVPDRQDGAGAAPGASPDGLNAVAGT